MRDHLVFFALGAILAAGCDEVVKSDVADGGTGADTDADTDADIDCDEDGGIGDCGPPWGWYDEASGLCWQDPAHDEPLSWEDAIDYCDALVLCGRGDWRLPSISELRTFIRGCEATMPGGECGVTDECGSECLWSTACEGCNACEGSGMPCGGGFPAGQYLDPGVVGNALYNEWARMWSSTESSGIDVWILGTDAGAIVEMEISGEQGPAASAVVCVRDGL